MRWFPILFLAACAGPVPVEVDPDIGEVLAMQVLAARELWGAELFVDGPGGIRIVSECGGRWAGHTHLDSGMGTTGTVRLCRDLLDPADPYVSYGAVVHELGHVLRLEHTEESGNVMNPLLPAPWGIADWQLEQVR